MSGGLQPLLFNQAAPVPITQALKPYQHRSAQALPKLPSLATPWVELGYTLGRVCEICSEHYTCRFVFSAKNYALCIMNYELNSYLVAVIDTSARLRRFAFSAKNYEL